MHEVFWVRHAQSTANVGARTDNAPGVLLTPRGHEQAADFAESWNPRPALIVTSPYVRTQLTAAPLMKKFHLVPCEEWPVQEFTFLTRGDIRGTTIEERRKMAAPYWEKMDPDLELGDGGESFARFYDRIRGVLERLMQPREGPIVIFTHNRVLMLLIQMVVMPPRTPLEAMRRLHAVLLTWEVPNCGVVRMRIDNGRATIGA